MSTNMQMLETLPAEPRLLSAEEATKIAVKFLQRLGRARGLKPRSVSRDGDLVIVELDIKNATATISVNQNKQIKQYTIEASDEVSEFSLTPRSIIMIAGIALLVHFVLSALGVSLPRLLGL